jgi:hypothetical protein
MSGCSWVGLGTSGGGASSLKLSVGEQKRDKAAEKENWSTAFHAESVMFVEQFRTVQQLST